MRILTLFCLILCSLQFSAGQSSPFALAPLFGDNMVLQQQVTVPIWGTGTPGVTVILETSWGTEATSLVQPDGSWRIMAKTPVAGGPYEMRIRHGDTMAFVKNILAGEVWLCSGQSNMEMPLEGWPPDTILDATYEIEHAAYPGIRLFNVRRAASPTPANACTGEWEETTPATARGFSATAYFFGRELHRSLRVPIGLIDASFGGTPVEAWTGAGFLSRVQWYDTTLQKVQKAIGEEQTLYKWLSQFPILDVKQRPLATRWQGLSFNDSTCSSPLLADSDWSTMRLPTVWERTELGEFDGVVWFRKAVRIPSAWVGKELTLSLGPIDDMDATFVNGQEVGSHETGGQWKVDRVYRVPAATVDTTLLCIAVRVLDNGGGGGIFGDSASMTLRPATGGDAIALAGEWRYRPVADYRDDRFYVFGATGNPLKSRPAMSIEITGYTPTALYNGMISPLVPFKLAGVIWYQGEANTGAPQKYKTLFPLMINNWRNSFADEHLPFYYVQLAPYAYDPGTESAFLREAQADALQMANTGMVVTLDIGNPKNIHPANKQEVGRRLALWALARTYGRKVDYTGPVYRTQRKFKDRIELSFDHVGNGLIVTGGEEGNGFEVAGRDQMFRPARVQIKGARIIVSNPDLGSPEAVRYAFRNTSRGTLFNSSGLPASSFRTDSWDPWRTADSVSYQIK